jgi:hypothetical protein
MSRSYGRPDRKLAPRVDRRTLVVDLQHGEPVNIAEATDRRTQQCQLVWLAEPVPDDAPDVEAVEFDCADARADWRGSLIADRWRRC